MLVSTEKARCTIILTLSPGSPLPWLGGSAVLVIHAFMMTSVLLLSSGPRPVVVVVRHPTTTFLIVPLQKVRVAMMIA